MIQILIAFMGLINVGISQDFTPDFCQPEQVRLSVRGKLELTLQPPGGANSGAILSYFARGL